MLLTAAFTRLSPQNGCGSWFVWVVDIHIQQHFSVLMSGPDEKTEIHISDTLEIHVEGTHVDITVKIYVVDAHEDKLYEIYEVAADDFRLHDDVVPSIHVGS